MPTIRERAPWVRIAAVLLLLFGSLWTAARPAPGEPVVTATPPATLHPLEGFGQCLKCHDPKGEIRPTPADHQGRAADSCLLCHTPASTPSAATGVKTPTAAQGAEAELVAASARCRTCHKSREFHIVADFASRSDTVKALEGDRMYAHRFVACVSCHPGDPHQKLDGVSKESIANACGHAEPL